MALNTTFDTAIEAGWTEIIVLNEEDRRGKGVSNLIELKGKFGLVSVLQDELSAAQEKACLHNPVRQEMR